MQTLYTIRLLIRNPVNLEYLEESSLEIECEKIEEVFRRIFNNYIYSKREIKKFAKNSKTYKVLKTWIEKWEKEINNIWKFSYSLDETPKLKELEKINKSKKILRSTYLKTTNIKRKESLEKMLMAVEKALIKDKIFGNINKENLILFLNQDDYEDLKLLNLINNSTIQRIEYERGFCLPGEATIGRIIKEEKSKKQFGFMYKGINVREGVFSERVSFEIDASKILVKLFPEKFTASDDFYENPEIFIFHHKKWLKFKNFLAKQKIFFPAIIGYLITIFCNLDSIKKWMKEN